MMPCSCHDGEVLFLLIHMSPRMVMSVDGYVSVDLVHISIETKDDKLTALQSSITTLESTLQSQQQELQAQEEEFRKIMMKIVTMEAKQKKIFLQEKVIDYVLLCMLCYVCYVMLCYYSLA